ncbi:39S ribosomal protein L35, mitochondrial-like [Argonauta hians]
MSAMACFRFGFRAFTATTQYAAKCMYSPATLPVISSISSKTLLHSSNFQKSLMPFKSFVSVCQPTQIQTHRIIGLHGLNQKPLCAPLLPNITNVRSKIVCSRIKGKPKSTPSVTSRFFRLRSGLWIRCRSGRRNKHWAKSTKRINRLQETVFCNKTQCKKLDRMVSRYYMKKRYFPGDPYEIYQDRSTSKFSQKRPLFFP